MRFIVLAMLIGCTLAASVDRVRRDDGDEGSNESDSLEMRVRREIHAAEVNCPAELWKDGKICYDIDYTLKGSEIVTILQKVFDDFMDVSCVKFIEKASDTENVCDGVPAIPVTLGDQSAGCWAHIGCSETQPTKINVSPNCAHFGVLAHEVFHTLGRYHEQSRKDRDDHITVNWDNIKATKKGNYKKCANSPYTDTYDFQSIMHYGDQFFVSPTATGSKQTMTIKDPKYKMYQGLMGTQTRFSPLDIVTVNKMYNCYPDNLDVNCAHGGVKKSDGTCFCVEPFKGDTCQEIDPELGLSVNVEGDTFLESDNFPGKYPTHEKQFIVLECPTGKHVSIKFLTFKVEQYGPGCGYDWVEMRPQTGEIYGVKYCGTMLKDDTIVSEDNFLVFTFVTNESYQYEGYEDEITCVD